MDLFTNIINEANYVLCPGNHVAGLRHLVQC